MEKCSFHSILFYFIITRENVDTLKTEVSHMTLVNVKVVISGTVSEMTIFRPRLVIVTTVCCQCMGYSVESRIRYGMYTNYKPTP